MISDVKKMADQKMHKSIETLKADLAKIRTGRAHDELQKLTDRFVAEIDKLMQVKEADLMAI